MADFSQHFKATFGFDAGNEKVVNVALADKNVNTDAVNVEFFNYHNGITQYDTTRGYDQYGTTIYQNRPYYAKEDITKPAGDFDPTKWQALRTDPRWDYIAATSGDTPLKSGDYIAADGQFANLTFSMPTKPAEGDTITVKDIGGKCGVNELSFLSSGHEFYHNGNVYNRKWYCTTPYAMNYFIFVRNRWHVYQTGTEPRGVYAQPAIDAIQMQNGDQVFRRSSLGNITLVLPKFANNGDMIQTTDLDGLTATNHVTVKVHEHAEEQSIGTSGLKEIIGKRSGHGVFIFDKTENLWRLWDGDQSVRLKPIIDDTRLQPNSYVAVFGDRDVTLTLPTNVEPGDRIQVSMQYMHGNQNCRIITATEDTKILMSKNMVQFPKRSEYPFNGTDTWKEVSELSFNAASDYVPYLEFSYSEGDDGKKHWLVAHSHPIVERVDPTRKERVGVIALATQTETNKNHEENPSDEVAVTPKMLANKTANETRRGIARIATQAETHQDTGSNFLDDVIVTPKKLNDCVATEARRGVMEIATQHETNEGLDDTRAITPKKLEERRASEDLAGIAEIVQAGGSAAARRGEAGTGIYNINDHAKIVTPQNINEVKATETSRGVGYLATDAEVQGATESTPQDALLITTRTLTKRTATESRTGIAEIATQEETNLGQSDNHIITPKKLHGKKATEGKEGIIRVGTQAETVAGTLANVAISPKNFKYVVQTEDTWKATEARRGFLKVATQENCFVGDNLQGSTQELGNYQHDGIAVTPKGLNYALANFLPKMATAQNSLKLGNVEAAKWARRDIDQTIESNYTFNKKVNVKGDLECLKSGSFETLYVTKNSTDDPSNGHLVLGERGVDGHTGITLHGTTASEGMKNSWSIIVGGTGTAQAVNSGAIAFGQINDGGVVEHYAFAMEHTGDATAYRNLMAGRNLYAKQGGLYIVDLSNPAMTRSSDGMLNIGHGGSVNIKAGYQNLTTEIAGQKYQIVHTGNADEVLNRQFVKNAGDTMVGKLTMDNAPIVSVKHEASAATAPAIGNIGFWNMRVTTQNIKETYPEKKNGTLMQWGTDADGLTQLWSPDGTHKHYIRSGTGGQWTAWGEIYTKQNKPTAQEIGAVVAEGGLMNSMTVRDWIKVGNVKIIANNLTRTVDFIWED
ncbi:long tail fiber proximal subunit [Escherichia phage E26]|uniref:Long tail fiber proximal subunit n=1 Tax=Escherichia phage E26 TaxID=2675201 RepID=A0A6B9M2U7_9CAUD|nr:long tail fiber proximal subunit [Escherichia phage E26]